jgi:putative copper export protein
MDVLFWLNVLSRWIHVTSAALLVGGLIVAGLVVLPALLGSGDGARGSLTEIWSRYRTLLHSALGLLLLTGVYNLTIVIPRARALGDAKSLYHGILGTKILLALIMFGVVSVLVSRRAAVEGQAADAPLPAPSPRPLPFSIALGLIVLLLSAILRRMWDLVSVVQ